MAAVRRRACGVDLETWPPVFEYISVSSTTMLTFSPRASTWSKPPKPMSYAQPSPPMIHCEFFVSIEREW